MKNDEKRAPWQAGGCRITPRMHTERRQAMMMVVVVVVRQDKEKRGSTRSKHAVFEKRGF